MRLPVSTSVFVTVLCFVRADAEIRKDGRTERIRGLPENVSHLYDQSKSTFNCLDKSKTISFAYVNDDYCDCQDGSDEPGTSACSNGKFHCVNRGHVGKSIPAAWVNDQVCDCCDGSDEYKGYIKCEDTCLELGERVREQERQREEQRRHGVRERKKLAEEGKRIIVEKEKRLDELKKDREDMMPARNEAESRKNEAEGKEKEAKKGHDDWWAEEEEKLTAEGDRKKADEAFDFLDANKDGKISFFEITSRPTYFDQDGDNRVTLENAKEIMADEEPERERFVEVTWPSIKDMFEAGKEMADLDDQPPPPEPEDDEDYVDKDDFGEDSAEKEEEEAVEEEGPQKPPYPEETQVLIEEADEARSEFKALDDQLKKLDKEIKELQDFLDTDFGPHFEFAPMKGECYDLTTPDYVYKLCPFDRVTQKNKDGTGSETSLGKWGEWIGHEDAPHTGMKFTKGQNCWNGPDRSTTVTLTCSDEHRVTEAYEPSRCTYAMAFETPAVCYGDESSTSTAPTPPSSSQDQHTEL